jgi:chitin disaccharide deacetylase
VYRQLAAFRCLVGKDPTHIDSHQHVHLREPIRTILLQISHKLAVPLRHYSPYVCYYGSFYGQTAEGTPRPGAISVNGLINILTMLPPGTTELGCHPGVGTDLNSLYRNERVEEMKVLCHPKVQAAIAAMGIQLRSFSNLSNGQ